jgi:hypothetical protein
MQVSEMEKHFLASGCSHVAPFVYVHVCLYACVLRGFIATDRRISMYFIYVQVSNILIQISKI